MRFFLDESGSTGDVAKVRATLDFGEQPVFVLAAIGTADEAALATELRRLAKAHGIIGAELRSKHLTAVPELVGALADYLHDTNSPFFAEMVDKRHLLVINLLNTMLLPPVAGFDEGGKAIPMRKILAEIMAASLPDTVLVAYARACESGHRGEVEYAFDALIAWADDPDRGAMRAILTQMVADGRKDLDDDLSAAAHHRFLPLSDTSVTGRATAMLPGLSSLTNIYARINKYRRGHLSGVMLVHDEHMLFGDILAEAKATMERLSDADIFPALPDADYKLREHASLVFANSREPGVQAADVLAGFIMRYFRDVSLGRPLTAANRSVMAKVMRLTEQRGARGINLVAADEFLHRAGFINLSG